MKGTVLEPFLARAARQADREAMRTLVPGGASAEATYTWGEWEREARLVAGALVAGAHQPGERVAILAGNHPLWPIADLGALLAGLVSVGLYPSSAPAQLRGLLADSGATTVLVDTTEQLAKIQAVRSSLPSLATVVAWDSKAPGVLSWPDWIESGRAALGPGSPIAREVRSRTAGVTPDTTALLIYTSGSTGQPKGAIIPHRYLLASAETIRNHLGLDERDSALSFLPYCHAAERIFGLYTRIVAGLSCGLVPDYGRLFQAARHFGPTLFGGLPRIYEKALETLPRGDGASLADVLGSRLRVATNGGAALPARLASAFAGNGVEVLGGYGLTEHLCAAMHRPGDVDPETVGPPMGRTRIRIAPDGEIEIERCDLTFAGYFDHADMTDQAFTEDGRWLRTGDLGRLDQRGHLRVTGRAKELIALSNGKKVAPAAIESALTRDGRVSQAMVFGEARHYLVALLVPSEATRQLAPTRQRETLDAVVAGVNADLSRPEQLKAWALAAEFTLVADELTPTLKLRRPVIAAHYRDQLDALYRSAS